MKGVEATIIFGIVFAIGAVIGVFEHRSTPETHYFTLTTWRHPDGKVTIPLAFEGDFETACEKAIQFAEASPYDPNDSGFFAVRSIERGWGWIRELDASV
jgi:hypothetical protein